ncbi:MAG: hypothetical protein A2Y24_07855 [Clostridiales bacterium GWE2_32_10]|nr:MAG: hypothetical protein A2Y24_07855 [Clostridiales bacterium GWE2_32_10]HBY21372.1 hypothetical protein [Clostridiales bacterium]
MKKFFCIIIFSIFLSACNSISEYEQVHNNVLEFEKYNYEMEFTVISNKNRNNYKVKVISVDKNCCQVEFLEPDNIRRIITKYNYNGVVQENTKIGDNIILDEAERFEYNVLLLSNFKQIYMKQDEVQITKLTNGDYKIELGIPNGKYYFSKQKIIFDAKDKRPAEIIVYDKDGRKTIEGKITYEGKSNS